MFWVRIDGLEQHWEQARVEAQFDKAANTITATTKNVPAITFDFGLDLFPLNREAHPEVQLNGVTLEGIWRQVPLTLTETGRWVWCG